MENLERVHIEIGNWRALECDVIILPAFASFLKRYGVSEEICRAAGEGLDSECMEFFGVVGGVELSRSYKLIQYGIAWLVHAIPCRGTTDKEEAEDTFMITLYKRCFQTCIDYNRIYRGHTKKLARRYCTDAQLETYLNKVERYMKKHTIKSIGIVPLKVYSNNKERVVRQSLEAISDFLSQDKMIKSVHIICEDVGTYNEYLKWMNT